MSLFGSGRKELSSSSLTSLDIWLWNPYVSVPLTCGTVLGGSLLWRRHFRRIPSADYVTPRTLARRKSIRGYVTSVGDNDNCRIWHTPGPWPLTKLWRPPTDKKLLKDKTIHIRLAGVDAPECAHFGKPAQPYSSEALQHLTSLVLNRNVKVEMLAKDQYGRIVGSISIRKPAWWPVRSDVSLEMLKAGFAEVYHNAGAEYGKIGKERLEKAQLKAQKKRVGMWVQKMSRYESPGAYKKRTAG